MTRAWRPPSPVGEDRNRHAEIEDHSHVLVAPAFTGARIATPEMSPVTLLVGKWRLPSPAGGGAVTLSIKSNTNH